MADPWVKGLRATVDENQRSKVKFRGSKVRKGWSQRYAGFQGRDRGKGRSFKLSRN